jgi:hypothetical protein
MAWVRFPVTLYKEQWLRVLDSAAEIRHSSREMIRASKRRSSEEAAETRAAVVDFERAA